MEADFSVSFINVGSADCTLIKCGDKSVLIDGGTNLVTDKITAYLKRSSVTHLDAVIVSHPDSDHIGSLPDIIDKFGAFISENIPTATKHPNTKSLLIL
jgi:competence protein ComEC